MIEGVDESLLSLRAASEDPLGRTPSNHADNFMTFSNAVLRSEEINCLSSEILLRKNSSEE
jgi:hypothetical protein